MISSARPTLSVFSSELTNLLAPLSVLTCESLEALFEEISLGHEIFRVLERAAVYLGKSKDQGARQDSIEGL